MATEILVKDAANQQVLVATNDAVIVKLIDILAKLSSDPATDTALASLLAELEAVSAALGPAASINTKPKALTAAVAVAITAAAGVSTALIGATARIGLLIYNEGPETVYIQASNATAKSPFVLASGGVLPVSLAQALWVYNPGGVASQLYIAELT
jgi:hypothetical protein